MAAIRLAVRLTLTDEELTKLIAMTRSRTEPASRVDRARMLLAYRDNPSFFAVGRALLPLRSARTKGSGDQFVF
jgi:hypothetical protein